MRAEPDLIERGGGRDEDDFHAGGAGAVHSGLAVFEDQATVRGDVHEFGGFEEHVRGGFAVNDVFRGDDVGEDALEADDLQGAEDDTSPAAGGDGDRVGACDLAGEVPHDRDRADGVEHTEVKIFLEVGNGGGVQGGAVEGVEAFDHAAGADAGPGIVKRFLELEAGTGLLERGAPGAEMDRHRIGERAVAVENITVKAFVREGEWRHGGHLSQTGTGCQSSE